MWCSCVRCEQMSVNVTARTGPKLVRSTMAGAAEEADGWSDLPPTETVACSGIARAAEWLHREVKTPRDGACWHVYMRSE